ncbi:MAG: hypothetical protein RJB68_2517 [Pseudomonadota bacterium]|jgi:lysophospholipase L1-like esterase
MPNISGTVYDSGGSPAGGRVVRAYRRDTGALLGETASSSGLGYRVLHGPAPAPADENATFNDEGTSLTGWTATNSTLSNASSWNRQTKITAGSFAAMSKTISTFTPTNRDWILYGKCRAANTGIGAVWMLNGSKEVSLWFGTSAANSSFTAGAVSLSGTTSSGAVRNVASCATGLSYSTEPVEFALQYDSKFGKLACFFREADGKWKFKAQVACEWFSSTTLEVVNASNAPSGFWVEFDYLSLCKPNFVAIGDSICEGKTLFSPNQTLALTNDESTWQRNAVLAPTFRNNLIVNKGVGGQSSTQILARIAEATREGPRVVFLHASSNDEATGVSQTTRTSNIQASMDAITAAGQQVILLNAMYGKSGGADNSPTPDLRDYMTTWWTTKAASLSGNYMAIDIMASIIDGSGFMQSGLTQSDGIHPTPAGYAAIGDSIERSFASRQLGDYLLRTSFAGACYVVALDDDAGTTYNDLILRTTPV